MFSIHDYTCGGNHKTAGEVWQNKYGFYIVRGSVNSSFGSAVSSFWAVPISFFDNYHIYTIEWTADNMIVKIDGVARAHFTSEDCLIPNHPMTVWASMQSINGLSNKKDINGKNIVYEYDNIPFPATDIELLIDWVKVE